MNMNDESVDKDWYGAFNPGKQLKLSTTAKYCLFFIIYFIILEKLKPIQYSITAVSFLAYFPMFYSIIFVIKFHPDITLIEHKVNLGSNISYALCSFLVQEKKSPYKVLSRQLKFNINAH